MDRHTKGYDLTMDTSEGRQRLVAVKGRVKAGESARTTVGGVASLVVIGAGVLVATAWMLSGGRSGGAGAVADGRIIALPGPVYDLAYDRDRNALWFAYMSGDGPAILFEYGIASGLLSSNELPDTVHNGFLERVAVAPDGAVWVTEEYSIVRFDPSTAEIVSKSLAAEDRDAAGDSLNENSESPGTWPAAIAFDSSGAALLVRHNVRAVMKLNNSLSAVGRFLLPGPVESPGDIIDVAGVIYVAPYLGAGSTVSLTEGGRLIALSPTTSIRLASGRGKILSIGRQGATWVVPAGDVGNLISGGSPHDRAVVGPEGVVVYSDGPAKLTWLDDNGAIQRIIDLSGEQINVTNPRGGVQSALAAHRIGALAIDASGSAWYTDVMARSLVSVP